jgi:hypothetical protein
MSGYLADMHLSEAYKKLLQGSVGLRAHANRFRGRHWSGDNRQAVRKSRDGYELRVYRIEGGVEACVIRPDGQSFTYA